MAKSSNPRPAPLMVRLSDRQRSQLERMAAGKPLPTYAKSILFAEQDRVSTARLLAWLGQTQVAAHLAIIANAAESGSLDMNEPVTKAVVKACSDIEFMRDALMQALGKQASPSEFNPPSTKLKLSPNEFKLLAVTFDDLSERSR